MLMLMPMPPDPLVTRAKTLNAQRKYTEALPLLQRFSLTRKATIALIAAAQETGPTSPMCR